MSQQHFVLRPASSNDASTSEVKDIFSTYLPYWPLFAVALAVALATAVGYLKMVKPTYEIKASLLIQDGSKTPTKRSALQEIDLANSPKVAENELEVLKSRNLIEQTVKDLNLWTHYFTDEAFAPADLYGRSPIIFLLNNSRFPVSEQVFKISILNNKSFNLLTSDGHSTTYLFGSPVESAGMQWHLQPTKDIAAYLGKTIVIRIENPDKVAANYQNSMVVELLNKQAPAIGLTIEDKIPARGQLLLNSLIKRYTETATSEKNRTTESTLAFIDKRLALLSSELNTLESKVQGFRSSRGLTDIASQSAMYLENVQSNDAQLNQVNIQLGVIDEVSRYVNASDFRGVPATMGINDPTLSSLIEKLSLLQVQREKLLATTPETNPIFDPIDKQINATKSAIIGNVGALKASLLGTKKQLQGVTGKLASSIRNVPIQERQLVGIKRQQTIKENLYLYLLQKREEVALSYAPLLSDTRIVDSAYTASVKWPKTAFVLVLAVIIGLGLPLGLVVVKEGVRSSITGRKEIELSAQLPLLTELSFQKESAPLVLATSGEYSALGEQFRWLRTSLRSLHGHTGSGRVTLLTSSVESEGKSFVCSNLGVALGLAGRRTIILELDLRRPRQAEVFQRNQPHFGASDLLTGMCTLNDAIQPSDVTTNLSIITSGNLVSNPSELLEHPNLEALVQQLREQYDDILIDTPPAYLVTDAMILSRLADVTLYIVRESYTLKSLLPFIQKQFKEEVFPRMNIVLNGVRANNQSYGYAGYRPKLEAKS